jgi:hypothetical protein
MDADFSRHSQYTSVCWMENSLCTMMNLLQLIIYCPPDLVAYRKEEKMNYRWNQNHLNYKEDFEVLRRGGFTEHEKEQLIQLRRDRIELEISRNSAEYHRLAFVRWLVATGKLSEHLEP